MHLCFLSLQDRSGRGFSSMEWKTENLGCSNREKSNSYYKAFLVEWGNGGLVSPLKQVTVYAVLVKIQKKIMFLFFYPKPSQAETE